MTGTSLVVDGGYLAAAEWEHPGTPDSWIRNMPSDNIRQNAKHSEWRLACADFTFPLLPHDNVLDLIAALELDGIDIGLFEGRSHLWPSREFSDLSQIGANAARQACRSRPRAGRRVSCNWIPISFRTRSISQMPRDGNMRARHISAHARIRQSAWFAARHDAAGRLLRKRRTGGRFVAASQDELAWRVEQAKRHGHQFSVEAHVGSLAPNPREAERMVRGVPGLTLTLDYTHFTRIGLPDAEIEPLVQYATHFHVRGARQGSAAGVV